MERSLLHRGLALPLLVAGVAGCSAGAGAVVDAGTPDAGCIIAGNVTVHTNAEWQALVATGCTSVERQLTLTAPPDAMSGEPAVLSPPADALKSVGGLSISGGWSGVAGFPSMVEITGGGSGLSVGGTTLTGLDFPALTSILGPRGEGYALDIESNPELTAINLPTLRTASSGVIGGNRTLRQCIVDGLKRQMPGTYWDPPMNGPNAGMPNVCP